MLSERVSGDDCPVQGYTTHIWRRESNLLARRWTVTPGDPCPGTGIHGVATTANTFRGSLTARFVCSWRASANALGFGPDSYARLFIDNDALQRLAPALARFKATGSLPVVFKFGSRDAVLSQQARNPRNEVDMLSYIQVRTCWLDDCVSRFVDQHRDAPGPFNVVLVGAGFDTRLYRLPLPSAAQLWEVDAQGTQEFKLEVLRSAARTETAVFFEEGRVSYVPLDLTRKPLLASLAARGFDSCLPTLFICEGVLPYLHVRDVEAVLHDVATASGPSAIAFDFVAAGFKAGQPVREGMHRVGEPWLFDCPDVHFMTRMCAVAGLRVIEALSVLDGLERYLPVTSDGHSVGFGSPEVRFLVAVNSRFAAMLKDG